MTAAIITIIIATAPIAAPYSHSGVVAAGVGVGVGEVVVAGPVNTISIW